MEQGVQFVDHGSPGGAPPDGGPWNEGGAEAAPPTAAYIAAQQQAAAAEACAAPESNIMVSAAHKRQQRQAKARRILREAVRLASGNARVRSVDTWKMGGMDFAKLARVLVQVAKTGEHGSWTA